MLSDFTNEGIFSDTSCLGENHLCFANQRGSVEKAEKVLGSLDLGVSPDLETRLVIQSASSREPTKIKKKKNTKKYCVEGHGRWSLGLGQ